MSSRRQRRVPYLRTTPRIRYQEHAAHPLRTPILEQPNAGQRGTRAFPRSSSMTSRGPTCAPYLRNTSNYAANPTPIKCSPPTPHTPSGTAKCFQAEHQSVSTPVFNDIPRAGVCSLPKDYQQLRRESDTKSTPPTHSARPLWSSQMLTSVAPERLHAHLQCHPEGRDVLPA
jgi:hypothetical protein